MHGTPISRPIREIPDGMHVRDFFELSIMVLASAVLVSAGLLVVLVLLRFILAVAGMRPEGMPELVRVIEEQTAKKVPHGGDG